MRISPGYLKPVSDAVGDALAIDVLVALVEAATGNDLYSVYASAGDPTRKAVFRTLEELGKNDSEHWLLIAVMAEVLADAALRDLIVKGCPSTLVSPPGIDGFVQRALDALAWARSRVLASGNHLAVRPYRAEIAEVSDRIRRLAAYKTLHEALHGLDLKLTFQPDLDLRDALQATADLVRVGSTALGKAAEAERPWMAAFTRAVTAHADAVTAMDPAAGDRLTEIQRLVRFQLARLNGALLADAKDLTLGRLVAILRQPLVAEQGVDELDFAVLNLKSAMLARVLVHRIWQDAESAFSLIEGSLSAPASSAEEVIEDWFLLQRQLLWLASLDPEAEWSSQVRAIADGIVDQLNEHSFNAAIGPQIAILHRLIKFRFFAVDAALKSDCGVLDKLYVPLTDLVAEIGRVKPSVTSV